MPQQAAGLDPNPQVRRELLLSKIAKVT